MTSDILGGLFKGLSNFMPADDPDTKIFSATNALSELQQQEEQVYATLGKRVFPTICDCADYADLLEELRVVQKKLVEAKEKLQAAQAAKKAAEQEFMDCICPSCGEENSVGTKFCQNCGTRLGGAALICQSCGTKNKADTRFCVECGTKLS